MGNACGEVEANLRMGSRESNMWTGAGLIRMDAGTLHFSLPQSRFK